MSKNCEFGDLADTLIKNHVINTCISKEFRRVLLREDDLDLEEVVNLGRSYDIADEQAKFIETQMDGQISYVAHRQQSKDSHRKVKRSFKGHGDYKNKGYKDKEEGRKGKTCFYCGNEYPHEKECPAKGKTCATCGGKNHFARMCRSKRGSFSKKPSNHKVHEIEERVEGASLFSISSIESAPIADVRIHDLRVRVKLDTGASANVMDESTFGHYSFLDQSVSICIKVYQNFVKFKHTIIPDVHYVFVY